MDKRTFLNKKAKPVSVSVIVSENALANQLPVSVRVENNITSHMYVKTKLWRHFTVNGEQTTRHAELVDESKRFKIGARKQKDVKACMYIGPLVADKEALRSTFSNLTPRQITTYWASFPSWFCHNYVLEVYITFPFIVDGQREHVFPIRLTCPQDHDVDTEFSEKYQQAVMAPDTSTTKMNFAEIAMASFGSLEAWLPEGVSTKNNPMSTQPQQSTAVC
jgi:hypothetical protein